MRRCHKENGIVIPGCWGTAVYGPDRCCCPPLRSPQHREQVALTKRVAKLERQVRELVAATPKGGA